MQMAVVAPRALYGSSRPRMWSPLVYGWFVQFKDVKAQDSLGHLTRVSYRRNVELELVVKNRVIEQLGFSLASQWQGAMVGLCLKLYPVVSFRQQGGRPLGDEGERIKIRNWQQ